MPIADWSVPFELTSPYTWPGDRLLLNQGISYPSGNGIFLLNQESCKLGPTVRAQKEDVPQEDGSILHCRYLTGMEMNLTIQLWEGRERPACNELLQEMLDDIMGYLYWLINADDNRGRVQWTPEGASDQRMLDDVRLLTYPVEAHPASGVMELAVTLDSQWPYVANLTEEVTAPNVYPTLPGNVTNQGNRPSFPVWHIDGPVSYTTLKNTATGEQFSWDGSRPGTDTIDAGDYLEIDTFRNTVYKNGDGSNLKAGIVMESSEFFTIPPGTWPITLSEGAATSYVLLNSAWA